MPNDRGQVSLETLATDLNRLVSAKREFVSISKISGKDSVIFDLALPIDAGAKENFIIKAKSSKDGIEAFEVGGRLPRPGCPERHINFDGSLCLGLAPDVTKFIRNEGDASDWWASLESHLQLQVIAEVLGRWDASREFSHGDAGHFQREAEKLADSLGILSLYEEGVQNRAGPFGRDLPKIRKSTSLLVNQRAFCPCERANRRMEHHIRRRCPDKDVVAKLVRAERKRLKAIDDFWKEVRKQGWKCCGTMRDCPLKKLELL